ncbi:MAG: hypothetical protein M3Z02_11885 [Actinomycetota bacterium]|nr:hypothetical protein [Actinomycetota bacterium]
MARGRHRSVQRRSPDWPRLAQVLIILTLCVTAGLLATAARDDRLLRAATVPALAAVAVAALRGERSASAPPRHASHGGDAARAADAAPAHGPPDDGVRLELAGLRTAVAELAARLETAAPERPPVPAVLATPSSALLLPLVRAALLETALSNHGNGNGNGQHNVESNGSHRVLTLPERAEAASPA